MCYTYRYDISRKQWLRRLDKSTLSQLGVKRLVMNYLVTEGYKDVVEKFQQEANVESPVELNTLDDRIIIREAVHSGRIEEAVNLVNGLHPDLLDNDPILFFHLQQLRLIELIRSGKIKEALTFAQNQLSESSENIPEVICEIERTLALLAFENPHDSPFAELLNNSYKQKIACQLNAAILKYEKSADSTPKLVFLLKLIQWAQSKLESRMVNYPKMEDFEKALVKPKINKVCPAPNVSPPRKIVNFNI